MVVLQFYVFLYFFFSVLFLCCFLPLWRGCVMSSLGVFHTCTCTIEIPKEGLKSTLLSLLTSFDELLRGHVVIVDEIGPGSAALAAHHIGFPPKLVSLVSFPPSWRGLRTIVQQLHAASLQAAATEKTWSLIEHRGQHCMHWWVLSFSPSGRQGDQINPVIEVGEVQEHTGHELLVGTLNFCT